MIKKLLTFKLNLLQQETNANINDDIWWSLRELIYKLSSIASNWFEKLPSPFIPENGRYTFIDLVRGVLLFWMTSAHVLTLRHVPAGHFLQLLRPSGWSTEAFIMLSGFSLAMVYRKATYEKAKGKLWHRAWELAIIAFFSNLISSVISERSLEKIISVLTFSSPWSISQYLIPTTLIVLLGPFLLFYSRKIGGKKVLLVSSGILAIGGISVDLAVKHDMLPGILNGLFYGSGIFNVWIIPYCFAGVWSLALAEFLLQKKSAKLMVILNFVAGLLLTIYQDPLNNYLATWPLILHFVVAISRFLLIFGAALLASKFLEMEYLSTIKKVLSTLGRSSLLVFIIHRPLVHLFNRVLTVIRVENLVVSTIGVLLFTGVALFLLCWVREKSEKINHCLKSIGF